MWKFHRKPLWLSLAWTMSKRTGVDFPEALYVHIPFCKKKCTYCDFNSLTESESLYEAYLNSLKRELTARAASWGTASFRSIFIGGGTPTVLPLFLLERLLVLLQPFLPLDGDYEWTTEANPESLSGDTLMLLREHGVNRLSLGVQSLQPRTLQFLGRIHDRKQALEAFVAARQAGFTNLSMDLMYGIPGETEVEWQKTLEEALSLSPDHLSLYQLKVEENTPLAEALQKNEFTEFADGQAEALYHYNLQRLESAGLFQYEISNFARPGKQSRHNLTYWNYLPYGAMGYGAVAFTGAQRWQYGGTLQDYLLDTDFTPASYTMESLGLQEQMSEFVMMNLRKKEGFLLSDFQERFGKELPAVFARALEKTRGKGLLSLDNSRVQLTPDGVLMGNLVFEEFVK